MQDMDELYFDFVEERHRIWERRQAGAEPPWTENRILAGKKFTNVYRVLDYGSQYLMTALLDRPVDFHTQLMRAFLYRYLNRPEPFDAFYEEFNRMMFRQDLITLLPDFWRSYRDAGNPLFGTAYKMFVGKENTGVDRLSWILKLTSDTFYDNRISRPFFESSSAQDRVAILRTVPRCGPFMAMQITTDLGYLDDGYDEDAFVVPGPGAIRGAKLVAPDQNPAETIRLAHREFQSRGTVLLNGRPPSLMDVQNTFCEFQKYVRYLRAGKLGPHRVYRPAHPGPQLRPWLPPHWNEGDRS